ncbi:hypothetical protein TNCV_756251 [Trichonephila clavipes]|nr:hypothetical protein TNCV_756251 [Trichonephila clavipes]
MNRTSAIRYRSHLGLCSHQNMTLLNSRGGTTTRPTSFFIGRPTKVCTGPSVSLASYSRGPNNSTLWPVLNDLAPDVRLQIWTLVHHAVIVFLKSFSCHLPRRQCSQLDKLRQLSPGGALLCPL